MAKYRSWALLLVVALALVACSPKASNDVEVFTWWASGSEKSGLDALVKVFDEQHPTLNFVNGSVLGGAGSNARDVLASRMAAHNPPDTFQVHAGMELADYIKAGQVQDLAAMYTENGWRDVFPARLLELLTVDGKIYSVPSNVHRANMVWANSDVLARAGIDPRQNPASLDEWFGQLDRVKATGVTPLAMGKDWTQVHLLETVLLSRLGPTAYTALFDTREGWDSPQVSGAIGDFARLLTYTNADSQFLEWSDALQQVVDGKAAYNVMGDWADAAFRDEGKKFEVDYTAFPVPGSAGAFDFLADSFTLPVGSKHETAAKAWLTTVGSAEGQRAFNVAKGSIPARTEMDASDYPKYQQLAHESYTNDVIVPSLAHGAATSVRWLADITTAVREFGTTRDIDKLRTTLVAVAVKSDP